MSTLIYQTDVYDLQWLDDAQTIILATVKAQWQWEDVYTAAKIINDTITATERTIYTIYDLTTSNIVPKGTSGLSHLKSLIAIDPPNEKMILFVGCSPFFRQMIQLLDKIGLRKETMSKYNFVDTLDDALVLIGASEVMTE